MGGSESQDLYSTAQVFELHAAIVAAFRHPNGHYCFPPTRTWSSFEGGIRVALGFGTDLASLLVLLSVSVGGMVVQLLGSFENGYLLGFGVL